MPRARYRTSGDLQVTQSVSPSKHPTIGSRNRDKILVQNYANFAPEQIEENAYTPAVTHTLEQAQTIGERTFGHTHLIADSKSRSSLKLDYTLGVLTTLQAGR